MLKEKIYFYQQYYYLYYRYIDIRQYSAVKHKKWTSDTSWQARTFLFQSASFIRISSFKVVDLSAGDFSKRWKTF